MGSKAIEQVSVDIGIAGFRIKEPWSSCVNFHLSEVYEKFIKTQYTIWHPYTTTQSQFFTDFLGGIIIKVPRFKISFPNLSPKPQ